MTAIELNAEIYRNLGYLADNEDYLRDILNYLKKLTIKKKASENRTRLNTQQRIVVTPEIQKQIDEARKEYKNCETLHFDTVEEMHKWMNSL